MLKTLLSNGMMSYSTLWFHSYTRINTKNILKHMCAGCSVEQKTWKRKWKKQRLSRELTYVANCLKFQHGKYMPIYTQIHFTRYKHLNSRHFLSFFLIIILWQYGFYYNFCRLQYLHSFETVSLLKHIITKLSWWIIELGKLKQSSKFNFLFVSPRFVLLQNMFFFSNSKFSCRKF